MFAKRVLLNISPSDKVDIIWSKLRYNRESHRFGTIDLGTSLEDASLENAASYYQKDAKDTTSSSMTHTVVDLNETSLTLYSSSFNQA